MTRRPLLGVFLGAVVGALVGGGGPAWVWGCASCMTLAMLAAAVRTRRGVLVASWLAAAALVAFSRAATGPPPRLITTCGVAVGAAAHAESRWRARIAGPREGTRVVAVLEAELCEGGWQPRGMQAALSLWDGPGLVRGDRIEVTLAVEPIGEARNRTDVDPRQRAMLDGLDVTARVRSAHLVISRGHGVLALVDRAREAAGQALTRRLSRERAAVAKGLVMGDRADLTALERDAWADAGLAHLLAVSGMHVTMIVVVVLTMVKLGLGVVPGVAERVPLTVAGALVALPCAAWFCLWSASPSSALRATIMGSVGLAGVVLGRHGKALDALCFTGFAMLVASPMLLHDPGFTLSMAAVGALLVLPRPDAIAGARAWCMRQLQTSISASIAATLATLPITASVFGRVSLVAPLTNLVAVPLGATLATPLAIAVVMLDPLVPGVADVASSGLDYLLAALLAIVKLGAALPGAALSLPRPGIIAIVAYSGLLAAFYKRAVALGVVSCAITAAALGTSCGRHPGDLSVELAYVGQGDGIIIHTPTGATMVVDAGGAITAGGVDPGRSVMAPLLRADGVRSIDLAVVTHPHPDHLGGFAYLAQRFAVKRLWSNGQDDDNQILTQLRDSVRRSGGISARPLELPAVVHFGGLIIDIIHPRAPPDSYLPELGANDNSLVLKLTHGQRSLLLTGDIEALAERELVMAPAVAADVGTSVLRADILKVAHHGSRSSSSDAFLDAVQPRLAIASCGVHNDFGFPHRETRERFAGRSIPFLTTRDHGAIRLRTDGTVWRIAAAVPPTYAKATAGIAWEALDD